LITRPHSENRFGEVISEGEEKFEKYRKTAGLFIGPLLFAIMLFVPVRGLSQEAHTLAAVMLWIIIWWITEPIPIPATALAGVILCTIAGVADIKKILIPFADPLIFLFLGSFILAKGMSVHHLDKRFAFSIMSVSWVKNSSGRILFLFGLIAAFLSMWISNSACTAMMFPIAIGIVNSMSEMISKNSGKSVNAGNLKYGTGLMLIAAYASSVGGIGTPIGTPPNIIGIGMIDKFTGIKISFLQWMSFALPLVILIYIALFLFLYFSHKPEIKHIEGAGEFIKNEKDKLGKWSRGQKNTLAAFIVAVILWLLPGFVTLFSGENSPLQNTIKSSFPESVAALAGAVLLFLLPLDRKKRKFTIEWKDAVKIDWGTLLLFGGGLSLGTLMYDTKLADFIGKGFINYAGVESVWMITLIVIFFTTFFTEVTSNTACANMVIPVVISVCLAANINPLPPAIGATLAASMGFMLPVSTPPNAIVYGSGMIPIRKMVRAGFLFDFISGIIIWLGLRLLLPLCGII
jgi:sodium-dependent dicarboxylate transporter 2/3/5